MSKGIHIMNKMMEVTDPLHKYPMCFDTAKACALIALEELQYQALELGHKNARNRLLDDEEDLINFKNKA